MSRVRTAFTLLVLLLATLIASAAGTDADENTQPRKVHLDAALALLKAHSFTQARVEIAQAEAMRSPTADDTEARIRELRMLGHAWADAGQPEEALALYHAERALSASLEARQRELTLGDWRQRFDSSRVQQEQQLLARDEILQARRQDNRELAREAGIAAAALLTLTLLLGGITVRRVQEANRQMRAHQGQLRLQSERDSLTDLANRRHFQAVMGQSQSLSFQGGLLLLDLDHFKQVNDLHGHGVGDEVLCEVARRLGRAVRNDDLAVRWGGEEFLIYAPGVNPQQLVQMAERMLGVIGGTSVRTATAQLSISASIGFAHFPLPPAQLPLAWEEAVNWTDRALYLAKARGRNCALGIAGVDSGEARTAGPCGALAERIDWITVAGPQQAAEAPVLDSLTAELS